MALNFCKFTTLSLLLATTFIFSAQSSLAEESSGKRPIIGINTDIQGDVPRKAVIYVQYLEAVRKAGGIPVLLPPMSKDELAAVLPKIDGILMIGGDDYPPSLFNQKQHESVSLMNQQRADFDMLLAAAVLADKSIPALGICAGCQALNIASGGDLVQDIPSAHPESKVNHRSPDPWKKGFNKHQVSFTPSSKIAAALKSDKLDVVTSHHQCVGKPGKDFLVTAKSDDGLVEAIEQPGERFLIGVQWHPERDFESNRALFEEFIKQAGKRSAQEKSLPLAQVDKK